MDRLQELREQKAALIAEANALSALAKQEKRDLSAEEAALQDEKLDASDALNPEIERLEAADKRADRLASATEFMNASKRKTNAGTPRRATATASTTTSTVSGDVDQHDFHYDANTPTGKVHDRLLDDPNMGFNHMGEFGLAVFAEGPGGNQPQDDRLKIMGAASGGSQTVGSDGGFLVPPAFSSMIWDGLNAGVDNLIGMTDNFTVERESLSFNANAETSRATGSRYGGIRGYWISEAEQITKSKPKFRKLKLEPQELAVFVYETDKLLRNAPIAFGQFLTRASTDEINFLTSDAIIDGKGAGKPKGILQSGALVTQPKENGQAANTIVHKNIINMWSRMHPRARQNAKWFINVDTEPQLNQMTLDVGTGGVPTYLPPGALASAPNASLLGREVIPIEYCKTLGTKGDIILADMSGYVTGTTGGIDSAMSIHLRFDFAETAFRFMFAVDGQTWLNSAITPFNGTNTLSHFVALATRS